MAVYRNEVVTKSGSVCLDGQIGCTGNYTGRKIDVANGIPALYFPFEPQFAAGAGAAGKSTVNIVIYGSGTVNTSGADQPLQNRSSITVPSGYNVYFQAVPAPGYKFQDWTSQDGAKSTSNPFTAPVTKNGTMSATFIPEKGTGVGTAGSMCSKGTQYKRGLQEQIFGCAAGYTATPTGDSMGTYDCVCNSRRSEYVPITDRVSGTTSISIQPATTAAAILSNPYILIGIIVLLIITLFRR